MTAERRVYDVTGVVQGVGFRPFVCRLASALELGGWVQNDPRGVRIVVEGLPEKLDRFAERVVVDAPALAHGVAWRLFERRPLASTSSRFAIAPSADSGSPTSLASLPPDVPPCAECLAEVRDPSSRRYRYALISCCQCGPRFSISRGAPFDRERTSLSPFSLCAEFIDY